VDAIGSKELNSVCNILNLASADNSWNILSIVLFLKFLG